MGLALHQANVLVKLAGKDSNVIHVFHCLDALTELVKKMLSSVFVMIQLSILEIIVINLFVAKVVYMGLAKNQENVCKCIGMS